MTPCSRTGHMSGRAISRSDLPEERVPHVGGHGSGGPPGDNLEEGYALRGAPSGVVAHGLAFRVGEGHAVLVENPLDLRFKVGLCHGPERRDGRIHGHLPPQPLASSTQRAHDIHHAVRVVAAVGGRRVLGRRHAREVPPALPYAQHLAAALPLHVLLGRRREPRHRLGGWRGGHGRRAEGAGLVHLKVHGPAAALHHLGLRLGRAELVGEALAHGAPGLRQSLRRERARLVRRRASHVGRRRRHGRPLDDDDGHVCPLRGGLLRPRRRAARAPSPALPVPGVLLAEEALAHELRAALRGRNEVARGDHLGQAAPAHRLPAGCPPTYVPLAEHALHLATGEGPFLHLVDREVEEHAHVADVSEYEARRDEDHKADEGGDAPVLGLLEDVHQGGEEPEEHAQQEPAPGLPEARLHGLHGAVH
mmetsp:Transcript_887/g.2769  ORF Transcript_887/g.2769 Transcript_887/m.2769 type:complete len:421 (-) Transcript_887:396-1658(-)